MLLQILKKEGKGEEGKEERVVGREGRGGRRRRLWAGPEEKNQKKKKRVARPG